MTDSIGGYYSRSKRMIVHSNYPYPGLVASVIKQWVDAGEPVEFEPRQKYLCKVTVKPLHD